MTLDPNDPRLGFDIEAMLDYLEATIGLSPEPRAELLEFMLVVNERGADGNLQSDVSAGGDGPDRREPD